MLHSRHNLVRPGVYGRQKNTLVGLVALGREESQGGGEFVPLSHPVGIALTH